MCFTNVKIYLTALRGGLCKLHEIFDVAFRVILHFRICMPQAVLGQLKQLELDLKCTCSGVSSRLSDPGSPLVEVATGVFILRGQLCHPHYECLHKCLCQIFLSHVTLSAPCLARVVILTMQCSPALPHFAFRTSLTARFNVHTLRWQWI